MFIVNNYLLAVVLCFVTMLCWGSWANTQKLASKTWRYELFYWDYVIGILLFSIFLGLTLGSTGDAGRSFIADLKQVTLGNYVSALIGGAVFNLGNILLSAAVSISGMTVAFPLGVGIALVLGVIVNYIGAPKGDPGVLFLGVALIVVAIILNAVASGKVQHSGSGSNKKGVWIAIIAGVLMSFFYRFVAAAMDLSNFVFNTIVMRRPFVGRPVSYDEYFRGGFNTHLVGIFGGIIWGLGTALSYIAAGKAGAAISYALGQGAPMVAALWGIFVWREFKGAPSSVNWLLTLMFIFFLSGLGAIIVSGAN